MTIRSWLLVMLGGALPLCSGCYLSSGGSSDDGDGTTSIAYDDGTVLIERAVQRGDLGDVRGYSGEAVVSALDYSTGRSSVRLDSYGEGWWVMSALQVIGLDIMSAAPGTYRSHDGSSGVYLAVTACSDGPSAWELRAVEVVMTIADDPDGSRTLSFDATFVHRGERQIGSGSFTYRASEGGALDPLAGDRSDLAPRGLVILDAVQEGSLGDVVSFRGDAAVREAAIYDGGAVGRVYLDSVGDGWWVATELAVSNLDLATAAPGVYRTAPEDLYDRTALRVSVYGRSGPAYDDERFIGGADTAELTIRDDADGSRTIDVAASFSLSWRPQSTHASFRIAVR